MSAPCKIELVAEAIGLKATRKNQNEWRFGSKGSLSLDLNKDQFFDHEANVGGGVTDFVIHMGYAQDQSEAIEFLKKSGLIADAINTATTKTTELRHHIYTDEQGHVLRKATKFADGRWIQPSVSPVAACCLVAVDDSDCLHPAAVKTIVRYDCWRRIRNGRRS